MVAQLALAFAVPAVFVAHAIALGIHAAGSPFKRHFWTS